MMTKQKIEEWQRKFENQSPEEIMRFFLNYYDNKIALSTSLGLEDQVLTHMLAQINSQARLFTLDTGRLFPETYDLIDRTAKKYNLTIEVFFPDATDVEKMVKAKGINLFYDSIDNRKYCCKIRKLKPLARAITGLDAWITGLRRDQSVTRKDLQKIEWDEVNGLLKINPIADWTLDAVEAYIAKNHIPVNPLHKKGFVSIGCQPCTRPIEKGEAIRAGRWWWENPETKECGLHKR